MSGGALVSAGSGVLRFIEPKEAYNIYIVFITGVNTSLAGDPTEVQQLNNTLSLLGPSQIITDENDLGSIVANTDDRTIIINLHGEAVPAPSWMWSGAGSLDETTSPSTWNGNPPDWEAWFAQIRDTIVNKGAIWLNVAGYPFYYLTNSSWATSPPSNRLGF